MTYYLKIFALFIGALFNSAFAQSVDTSVIKEYMRHVANVPMNHDVHILDPFVSAHLGHLVAFGVQNHLGVATLSQEEVTAILFNYLDEHPGFYHEYEGQNVSHEELKNFIQIALETAKRDPNVFQVYSLAISALNDFKKDNADVSTEFKLMFDCFAENYKTNGGCFQGVRNRMFVLYAQYICLFVG